MKKNCKRQIKQSSELKKLYRKKGNKLYVKWQGKVMIIHSIARLIKKV